MNVMYCSIKNIWNSWKFNLNSNLKQGNKNKEIWAPPAAGTCWY